MYIETIRIGKIDSSQLIVTCDERKKQRRVLEFMPLKARETLVMLDPPEEREKTQRRMRFFLFI